MDDEWMNEQIDNWMRMDEWMAILLCDFDEYMHVRCKMNDADIQNVVI